MAPNSKVFIVISESVARADAAFLELNGVTNVIPPGPYCYRLTGIEPGRDGVPVLKTRHCVYFAGLGGDGAYCAFTKVRDDVLLSDSCKICGANEDDGCEATAAA